jgi:hypothetical protein
MAELEPEGLEPGELGLGELEPEELGREGLEPVALAGLAGLVAAEQPASKRSAPPQPLGRLRK